MPSGGRSVICISSRHALHRQSSKFLLIYARWFASRTIPAQSHCSILPCEQLKHSPQRGHIFSIVSNLSVPAGLCCAGPVSGLLVLTYLHPAGLTHEAAEQQRALAGLLTDSRSDAFPTRVPGSVAVDICRDVYGASQQRDCPGVTPGSLLIAHSQPCYGCDLQTNPGQR